MNYRVIGLEPAPFRQFFQLGDDELATFGAKRVIADGPNAFPCRVSLEDAAPGEELLLLPYRHHTGPSPYQASGPIYVRRNAETRHDSVNAIPRMQLRRLCSVRAYGASGDLAVADVVPGTELEALLLRFLDRPDVSEIHVHNARPGCFAFRVERA
ncbi:MAG TPA: DUF1203 domain-containing protein [Candidatus Eisenbacteria bacterium]|nr:DUF1203 domain-containing protein [Candidatus Eisenbacteria bacterium]